jgi:hypothetical protein
MNGLQAISETAITDAPAAPGPTEIAPDSARMTGPDAQDGFSPIARVLAQHFEAPDIEAVKVILACVAAHRITDYPPAWALPIAPSGSLKTVVLETLRGLPSVRFVDEVTDKTFISGKMDGPKGKRKTPASYLHRIGNEGILVAADFGTVMSMDRRIRNKVLAQLRRIYDGHFSREFGTDENIQEREWTGRLTLLAGATPEVDRYHSVFQSLGERFLRVRWPRSGGVDAGLRAMRQTNAVPEELRGVVHGFLLPVLNQSRIEAPEIAPEWETRIAHLSELVALARVDVPRTRDGREVCGEPQPEGNTRLPQELAQVGRGWAALNNRASIGEGEYALIFRVGLDSIPPVRKRVLLAITRGESAYSLDVPEATAHRAIEDLELTGLVRVGTSELSDQGTALVETCFPQRVHG